VTENSPTLLASLVRPKEATPRSGIVDHVIDSLAHIGPVECKRFFGGWSLHLHGRQFACVIRNELYFSAEGHVREELIAAGSEPFTYDKADRTIIVAKYQSAPSACLDDPEMLYEWVSKLG
jgi:DNA transformation protein and related proteins